MALVDAQYNFLYVDVGAQGRLNDAGVFNNCSLSGRLLHNQLSIPAASVITNTDILCPYMIVADDAFPMSTFLMKPYSRRGMQKHELIFNYRFSRARRVVENAFGILANRFRVFRGPIAVKHTNAKSIVLAATALHNMLRAQTINNDNELQDDTDYGSSGNSAFVNMAPCHATGRQMDQPRKLRDKLAHYFLGDGAVEWQDSMVGIDK
jgi:DDE superfamily endonuclease